MYKKVFIIMLFLLSIFSISNASFLNQKVEESSSANKKLYSVVINTSIKKLSPLLKQEPKRIMEILIKNKIKVVNEDQTIIQIALSNAKNSDEIIDIILTR